jgi:maltose O-acetyltransferase
MKSEPEKMLSGDLYSPQAKELAEARLRAKRLLHRLNVTEYVMGPGAAALLKELIPNAPADLYIEPPFHCDYGGNIYCGSRVYFNVNCVVLDAARVEIGSRVLFGPGVHVYAATHPLDSATRKRWALARPVVIGDDCWIGGGAIINPGVRIGEGCVIGSGSVVTRDIPPHSLAAGNPARVIRSLR